MSTHVHLFFSQFGVNVQIASETGSQSTDQVSVECSRSGETFTKQIVKFSIFISENFNLDLTAQTSSSE